MTIGSLDQRDESILICGRKGNFFKVSSMDIGDAMNNGQKLAIYKNFLDKETRRLGKKFTGNIKIKS